MYQMVKNVYVFFFANQFFAPNPNAVSKMFLTVNSDFAFSHKKTEISGDLGISFCQTSLPSPFPFHSKLSVSCPYF